MVIAAFAASCGNSGNNESTVKPEANDGAQVQFAALTENPGEYVGKTIAVEGKVVHVCTHSGKKLFIVGENPDVRLFIQAGENMPKFPMDLLGSTVVVEGLVTKPVATATGGGEMAHGEGENKMAADTCETSKALAAQTSLADIVMEYKSHIVKQ
jgi:hypothetical protein